MRRLSGAQRCFSVALQRRRGSIVVMTSIRTCLTLARDPQRGPSERIGIEGNVTGIAPPDTSRSSQHEQSVTPAFSPTRPPRLSC